MYISKLGVYALSFQRIPFGIFPPTTWMYADIRGSGFEWNKVQYDGGTVEYPSELAER